MAFELTFRPFDPVTSSKASRVSLGLYLIVLPLMIMLLTRALADAPHWYKLIYVWASFVVMGIGFIILGHEDDGKKMSARAAVMIFSGVGMLVLGIIVQVVYSISQKNSPQPQYDPVMYG